MTTTEVRGSILDATRALAPEISARAAEGDALRTMPADLVDKVRGAGLFGLVLPRSLGGLEVDPVTLVEVTEELCRADGSAGWTIMIGNSTAFFAWLDPDVAREMIGDDTHFVSTAMLAPLGRATPTGTAAFTVDGRWPFNSGCRHADWIQASVMVMDGARPRMVPGHGPDQRLAFFRADDVEIVDNWDALGLRGTGSNDITVSGVSLPREHTASHYYELARHDGPLWRIPFYTMIAVHIVGFPLGVARRALDEFTELATTKKRGAAPTPVAETGDAQVELARAEAALRSARAFAFDAIGAMWDTACAGDPPSLEQRANVQLAALQAMRSATAAIDAVFPFAGAGAVYATQPLQRCYRDLHTAAQHIFFSAASWKRYAQLRLGIDQPTHMI